MHSLSIKYKDGLDENELWHAFYGLLVALRDNGQIFGQSMMSYAKNGRISATSPTATNDALAPQYFDENIKKSILKLEDLCSHKLETEWVGNGEDQVKSICQCTHFDHFMLYYRYPDDYSSLSCGTCGKRVPLFKVKGFKDTNLIYWQHIYGAITTLDIASSIGEKWAIKQECNVRSKLSIMGREIASKLTKNTGIKTYYHLANYAKRKKEKDMNRPCPSCGGEWHYTIENTLNIQHKCENCMLMSSYSSNQI
jgi:predicted  nucleic acid-binding Zn ribbon protein